MSRIKKLSVPELLQERARVKAEKRSLRVRRRRLRKLRSPKTLLILAVILAIGVSTAPLTLPYLTSRPNRIMRLYHDWTDWRQEWERREWEQKDVDVYEDTEVYDDNV